MRSKIPSPIRILIIEPSGNLYGSELYMFDLLRELDKTRFSVKVVLPHGAPLAKELEGAGIEYRSLLAPASLSGDRKSRYIAYLKLFTELVREHPDLVYVNQAGILRSVAGMAKLVGVPIACNVTTIEDAAWVSRFPWALRQVRAFVCPSLFVRSVLKAEDDRTSVIYRGYRHRGIKNPSPRPRGETFVAGIIGRVCEQKGHLFLLDIAEQLARQREPVRIIFIGDATRDDERDLIRTQIRSRGLESVVDWRGYRPDIGKELAELDLLLMPFRGDTFGKTLSEAAEAGVPVLLADSGGPGELSRHFNIGVRHTLGDTADFLMKFRDIRQDYNRVRADFVAGAQRLLEGLAVAPWARCMEEVFERAVAEERVSTTWRGTQCGGSRV